MRGKPWYSPVGNGGDGNGAGNARRGGLVDFAFSSPPPGAGLGDNHWAPPRPMVNESAGAGEAGGVAGSSRRVAETGMISTSWEDAFTGGGAGVAFNSARGVSEEGGSASSGQGKRQGMECCSPTAGPSGGGKVCPDTKK